MFKQNANATFNNRVFSDAIISGMPPEDEMHETMTRLYEAAKQLQVKPAIEGQSDLARALNVSPQVINNWEERGISRDGAITAQQLLGINAVWIRKNEGAAFEKGGVVSRLSIATSRSSTDLEIPQFRGVGGSMGNGLILRDLPGEIQGWRVTPEWLTKNVRSHTGIGNLCIVTGFGPSMKPMFNPGDPLLMDRGVKNVEFDGIYFFRVGEEGFIKMLQRVPGEGLRVVSKNKDYETWTIKADMDFEVFGLIIKVWCGTDS
jgi:hypothetical protein